MTALLGGASMSMYYEKDINAKKVDIADIEDMDKSGLVGAAKQELIIKVAVDDEANVDDIADNDILDDDLLLDGDASEYDNIYDALDDEDVVEMAKEGDKYAEGYLINKYKNLVRAKARSYFLIGADREDIIQEGMIGLFKAIRDYRDDKLSSFRAFAELCITRQIITAIKTATRQKHIPLNSYISLNKPIYDEESDRTLMDIITGSKISDPEELVISQEEFNNIEGKMGEILSPLEWKVLTAYLDGKTYQEIAEEFNRHVKSIDNALQRVKRKLTRYLTKRDS